MPASTDLTTYAKVKAYLGLADDTHQTLLEALIDSASEAIERDCGREFAQDERTEIHDGGGTPALVLRQRPVASVASVRIDGSRTFGAETEVDASAVVFYPDEGVLRLDNGGVFPKGRRNLRVVYTAGYGTVPPAVEQAANMLVAHFFHRGRQGGDGVASESMGAYSVSYDTESWPASVRALLADFRDISL